MTNKGFSILEVLVAAAISLMVFLGFASMSSQMNKEIKHSGQRADALEFRSSVGGLLSDLSVCSCQLNQSLASIDTTVLTPTAGLATLKTSCDPAATTFAAPNQTVLGSSSRLTINQMQLIDIENLGVADRYRGRLSFDYKSDNLIRAIAGFDLEVRFTTDPASPPTAKKLVSCDFVGAAVGGVGVGVLSLGCVRPASLLPESLEVLFSAQVLALVERSQMAQDFLPEVQALAVWGLTV
jgi:hypothetical protein